MHCVSEFWTNKYQVSAMIYQFIAIDSYGPL